MTRRITRRTFLSSTAAAAALVATGCSGSTSTTSEVTSSGTLRVLNWPDYIDPELIGVVQNDVGQVDYVPDWVENYTGADLFGSQWDIAVPTNWLAAQLIGEGRVERLPVEFIPNHQNIDPVFLTNNWDRGARFHMPWQSGITGIAYDPELTGRELTSFDDLFAPDLAGRVAMIGEMREAVGLAMLAAGADPTRPTNAEAEAAFARIEAAEQAGQFHSWVFEDFSDLLKSGDIAASMAWSGDVVQLQRERPDIEFVIPDEGAIQWFDTMVIPKGASNMRAAAAWMNAFYDPALAARNTQFVQYISPVLGVRDELLRLGGENAELARNPILFPNVNTQRSLFTWGGLDSFDDEADLDDRFATMAGLA